jgi:hypothetical protein
MGANLVLDMYLTQLGLPTFMQNYPRSAEEAAQSDHGYDRFLLALVEKEAAQRKRNRIARRNKGARFPALKELAGSDPIYLANPSLKTKAETPQSVVTVTGMPLPTAAADRWAGQMEDSGPPRRARSEMQSGSPSVQEFPTLGGDEATGLPANLSCW